MKSKKWLLGWAIIVVVSLSVVGVIVFKIDPFFHYHKPLIDNYFYKLNNQRSQNDGIAKHFDYDAIITGTSLTENFKTSELDERFGTNSIKISTSGASYKEINDNLKTALKNNPNVKMVVRGLDISMLIDDPNRLRTDLGEYPDYLYDDNPFNDVKYIFNKDVVFGRTHQMMVNSLNGEETGITSFDEYSRWQETATFGIKTVFPNGIEDIFVSDPYYMNEDQKENLVKNITQNVTDLADEYPNVDFYYFLAPYSIAWYKDEVLSGQVGKDIESEKLAIELMLEHPNIRIFGFSDDEEIIADMNNYKDTDHYASWINSYILKCLEENTHRITKDNYEDYLGNEFEYVSSFKYSELNNQIDYENDDYQGALWNQRIWGVEPINILNNNDVLQLQNTEITEQGIKVTNNKSEIKIKINNLGHHNYLVFYYKDLLQESKVIITSKDNTIEKELKIKDIDNTYKQEVIDISNVRDDITITFKLNSNSDSTVISDLFLY